ncbi:unnamed protein product [Arctia plantaginis]|uniref:Uncharacterized protein n=1 Tax=Arctia plantaginis TaxID=874455 RepID=A0A8S1B1W7_ARCPL|nr:unnamed protein product [Arctia plantaginis]
MYPWYAIRLIRQSDSDISEIYKATKTLTGNSRPKKKLLKSKDGQLIATSEHQLRHWRKHFEEVYRSITPTPTDTPQHTSIPSRLLDINVDPPTHDEVAKAIQSLKICKPSGLDLVTAEKTY